MNMWLILMIVLAVLSFAGILYLANRIGKFAFIRKITKGKKGFSTLTGLLIAVVYTAVIWMAWGSMNAIVCILHLIVFWMVSEAIFALITKIRKKTFAKYYAGDRGDRFYCMLSCSRLVSGTSCVGEEV